MNYLTIKHIVGKGKEIGSGWYHYLNKDKNVERSARERALICKGCEFRIKEAYLKYIKDEVKEIEGHLCTKCGCPLSMKVRSQNSNCPINKW